MTNQKPYTTIDVNGVRVTLCTKSWLDKQRFNRDHAWVVSAELLCTTRLDVNDLVKLAGVKDIFDYAVPQDWLDDRRKRGDKDEYIWVYSKGEMFGHPVSHSSLMKTAKENIFAAFLKDKQPLEV